MNVKHIDKSDLRVSVDSLYRIAGGGGSLYPSDDDPMPHGPWDPVIRGALSRLRVAAGLRRFGPHPDPWREGPQPDPWRWIDAVALNPQPLPPREVWLAAMAEEVILRAEMLADFAGLAENGEKQGIIIVGGYVSRFAGWCGNEPIVIRPPKGWPYPDPDPEPWWRAERLSGRDLMVVGSRFAAAARGAAGLAAQAFREAASTLAHEAAKRG